MATMSKVEVGSIWLSDMGSEYEVLAIYPAEGSRTERVDVVRLGGRDHDGEVYLWASASLTDTTMRRIA